MKKTLYWYLLKELFPSFFLGLVGFTFVLLTGRILQLTELFVNKGIPFSHLVKLIYYLLPSFLVLTIPMATLLSVLTTFNRLSSDNEVTALKASGVSLYQMTPPVAVLALLAFSATALLATYAQPRAKHASRSLLYEIASTKAHAGVKERVFNDDFEGLVLYVEKVLPNAYQWEHVFISDSRNASETVTIVAPEGDVLSDPLTMTVTLRLKNGAIHKLGQKPDSYQKIDFNAYDLRLDLKAAWREKPDSPKHPADMSLQELSRAIRLLRAQNADTKQHWVKVHEKFSIPFACLVFGLIAVPLGVQARSSRAGKSMGFAWSLGVLLVYYLMTNLGTSLAERGIVLLELGMWVPNALLLALGLYLLVKAARESPVFFIVWLNRLIEKIRRIGERTLGSKKWGSGE
ncbi:MAG: permease YjgP/YjgQ family protein [Deltaproteobacteria bacterium]|jgi:lipopolysaccharide export system permease protein|nr:permease YjgP/YjgQ family protein [Deltaproteobacteria bacterium]MBP1717285.1 permease YjgP/YjgQ family protein [Deltaproteobacteria bacterium]